MLGLLRTATRPPTNARIEGEIVSVDSGETLLQAALRAGLAFPNSCRVGGCGACKCRLKSGQVRELTETGYLLTREELDQGTILACQSAPLTDVEVEVDLPVAVSGRVVAQARMTHDITRLEIQLSRPFAYRAGQFAHVSIDALPGHVRTYSFATPSGPSGRVVFFIRHVPGGRFSGLVQHQDLAGHTVELQGPGGDFWLRGARTPLLFVAGGSGLAPILAMLESALADGVARPAVVLFGARTQADLYAMDTLERVGTHWGASFSVIPVLSEEPKDSDWTGARGLVTTKIGDHADRHTHAYVCGPPAMVDAARVVLDDAGLAVEHVHCDRFSTASDVAPAALDRKDAAGVWHYAKFCLFHVLGLYAALVLLAGGWWTTAGLVGLVASYTLGDRLGGDDTSTPHYTRPGLLTGLTWLALPLVALVTFVATWTVCSGDPLGFGAAVTVLSGFDVVALRDATHWGHHLSGLGLTILAVGLIALIPGHELVHRTWDRRSVVVGRWLYAFAMDAPFSIEHVYGHHRYVATCDDPATAPRGRSVYAHMVISSWRGNASAWRIERTRLERRALPVWSHHNAWLRGHAMSAALVACAWLMGGSVAALYFLACGLGGKAILEIVNYMEHYGMVRDPADPVQPHHSWNTNRCVSSWSMFNLTRHSHHHAQGEVPFGDLRPYPDAPMMVGGYLSTLFLTMVPPVWHWLMTPKVLEWDRVYATPHEKRMAWMANQRSGLPALVDVEPSAYGVEDAVGALTG